MKYYKLTLSEEEMHDLSHAIADRCRMLRVTADNSFRPRQMRIAAAEEVALLEDIGWRIYDTLYPQK